MELFSRDDIERRAVPGRFAQPAVGRDAHVGSDAMMVGFARYCDEAGPMEPHRHGEETVYVLAAQDGWVEWGPQKDDLTERRQLQAGMVLHVAPGEWHVFRHAPGGSIDILFVFAHPDGPTAAASQQGPENETPRRGS